LNSFEFKHSDTSQEIPCVNFKLFTMNWVGY
jgi:hypothetical protein